MASVRSVRRRRALCNVRRVGDPGTTARIVAPTIWAVRYESEATGAFVIEHEPLAAPLEVLEHERAGAWRRAGPADVDCSGLGNDRDPPPVAGARDGRSRSPRVEPVARVEATERFEHLAAHEEARADDETGRGSPRGQDAVQPDRFRPRSPGRRVRPEDLLVGAVFIPNAGRDHAEARLGIEGGDESLEVDGLDRGIGVEEQDELAGPERGALVRAGAKPAFTSLAITVAGVRCARITESSVDALSTTTT